MPLAVSSSPALKPQDADEQSQLVKAQAQDTMAQLSAITERIAQIEATGINASAPTREQSGTASVGERRFRKTTAVIDQERCINCGLCVHVCPEQAISMNYAVAIDSSKCTGCGSCVDECPNEAIVLSEAGSQCRHY